MQTFRNVSRLEQTRLNIMMISHPLAALFSCWVILTTSATAAELQVTPNALTLNGEPHAVLVAGTTPQGQPIDLTREVTFRMADPAIASVSAEGLCTPLQNGTTELIVEHQGTSQKIPVEVQSAEVPTPSFRNDIIPLLTRFGCNQGSCHGKQAGQNGFRLSLRGYAPDWDHGWLVREYEGRRVSQVNPDDSLILKKALGEMPHGGARLFQPNSRPHQMLKNWIAAGALNSPPEEPEVTQLIVTPRQRMLAPQQQQQILVQAVDSAGQTRDVTWLAQFFSSDSSLLEVTPSGLVTALRPGEGTIRVHFLQQVEIVTFSIPYPNSVAPEQYAPRFNAVDEHVLTKLSALRIPPSPMCDDATFLRRVSLDLTGTLPTPERIRSFLEDSRPDKRALVVEELLNSPEYIDFWTLQLGDLLQNRKERDHDVRGVKGVRMFHAWLREQVAHNRPWNELARDVLTAKGNSYENPAVGYYVVTVGEKGRAEESEVVSAVAQTFLGTRIGCAQCHNHPSEKYTQDDYYHFAGFFSRIQFNRQGPDRGPTQLFIANPDRGNMLRREEQLRQKIAELEAIPNRNEQQQKELESQQQQLEQTLKQLTEYKDPVVEIRQPRTGDMLSPRPLDRAPTEIGPQDDPREELVEWMLDPENRYFTGSMVNRLWKHFMQVGLVEPVDDLRSSNPPSNQPLWEELNREFVASGYNLKHLMRLIVNSGSYQRSSETLAGNEDENRFYSRYYARRLQAEVFLDAVSQSTSVPEYFDGYPRGMRAIQIPDPGVKSYFLEIFGKSQRVTACACERSGEVTLPQVLHIQNGNWYQDKLNAWNGTLKTLLKEQPDNHLVTEELFLRTLSRLPREEERQAITELLSEGLSREDAFRDVFWALLNTQEFAFNH